MFITSDSASYSNKIDVFRRTQIQTVISEDLTVTNLLNLVLPVHTCETEVTF